MKKNEIERVAPNLPAPGRVGQGTAVEQSRAAAEVLAAVEVAQRFPRDVQYALAQMRESCRQPHLAKKAFYRFPRGGQTVSGASVHLARELARCWGHIQHGLVEMRRDDEYGQSEMQAFAWDVQTNTRISSTFIVPHKRDTTKDGPKPLSDLRDIYENNTNQGSRRVREAIFAILPPWFVEEAKALCETTLDDGGGQPLAQRVSEALTAFEEMRITRKRLEAKIGRPTGEWTARDVSDLEVIYNSLRRREVSIDDEFPPERVTTDEITNPPPAARTPSPSADADAAAQAAGWPDVRRPGGES